MRNMKLKNLFVITLIVSSIFYITSYSIEAADIIITDGTGDVCSIDFLTGETKIITSHPDINVDNIDLIQATYTQQGTQATVTLQVKGNIEDRGKLLDWYNEDILNSLDTVYYEFQIFTSEQDYLVTYSNETGMQQYNDVQINLTTSNFSVVGNTLGISFSLKSGGETYSNLSVTSNFIKGSFLEDINIILLTDIAPNPPLAVYEAYASNIGSIGESIQFNASVEPLTGTPPYTYHWDFGDESSSTELNPIHIYRYAGIFMYKFTVTDKAGATANLSGNITIIDNYQLKKVFLFGSFKYLVVENNYITVEAINLWIFFFKPFQFLHFVSGQNIIFQNHYDGIIIDNDFLIGFFNIVIPFNTKDMLKSHLYVHS